MKRRLRGENELLKEIFSFLLQLTPASPPPQLFSDGTVGEVVDMNLLGNYYLSAKIILIQQLTFYGLSLDAASTCGLLLPGQQQEGEGGWRRQRER